MIKIKTKLTVKLPKLDLTKTLEKVAKSIIIPDMVLGINRSIDIDNKPFPKLAPETIARKTGVRKRARKQGGFTQSGIAGAKGGSQQLVNTGLLRESFKFKRKRKNNVIIFIDSVRARIGGFLQIEGVGKIKKKFKFFGVSQRAELQALSKMQSAIDAELRRSNRG